MILNSAQWMGEKKNTADAPQFQTVDQSPSPGVKDKGAGQRSNSVKSLRDSRGQRVARLVQIDRKVTLATCYRPRIETRAPERGAR